MNRKLLASLFAGSTLFLAQGAFAQYHGTDYDRINERIARQEDRIRAAEARGELRHGEARRLWNEHRMIRDKERAFLSDGVLTRREIAELNRDLDIASHNIRRLAHNERRADDRYSYNYR